MHVLVVLALGLGGRGDGSYFNIASEFKYCIQEFNIVFNNLADKQEYMRSRL
jgi:hypothetical protein